MEAESLKWLRLNQFKLYVLDYKVLMEALADSGKGGNEAGETRAGKHIAFPLCFHGNDLFMRQKIQKTIAISN